MTGRSSDLLTQSPTAGSGGLVPGGKNGIMDRSPGEFKTTSKSGHFYKSKFYTGGFLEPKDETFS